MIVVDTPQYFAAMLYLLEAATSFLERFNPPPVFQSELCLAALRALESAVSSYRKNALQSQDILHLASMAVLIQFENERLTGEYQRLWACQNKAYRLRRPELIVESKYKCSTVYPTHLEGQVLKYLSMCVLELGYKIDLHLHIHESDVLFVFYPGDHADQHLLIQTTLENNIPVIVLIKPEQRGAAWLKGATVYENTYDMMKKLPLEEWKAVKE